jgi:hypothetical protein
VEEYLDGFCGTESYNTKCENLKKDETCGVWGTSAFPEECLTFICQIKEFPKEFLAKIDTIEYFDTCDKCGTEYHYTQYHETSAGKRICRLTCPNCQNEWLWERSL